MDNLATSEELAHHRDGPTQERKRWLRAVQVAKPAAESRRISDSIRVLHRGRGRFPGAALYKVMPQRIAASQQTVVRIREREWRQEGEGLATKAADTPPDFDPAVLFIVSLLAAATVPDDRIPLASRTMAKNHFGTTRCPVIFQVDLLGRKWDTESRSNRGSAQVLTCQDLSPKRSPRLEKISTGKNNAFCGLLLREPLKAG